MICSCRPSTEERCERQRLRLDELRHVAPWTIGSEYYNRLVAAIIEHGLDAKAGEQEHTSGT